MKKQLGTYSILLILIASVFIYVNKPSLSPVRATYVEGQVTQDTFWTMVDSPFVVSNEVNVNTGATLTIEPGVEVRFGGNFSITVVGTLVANGTQERMIKFTSNRLSSQPGDWAAIRFKGAQSFLVNCVVEYGTNALMLESGNLYIQSSSVSANSQNGIILSNGNLRAENNNITDNGLSGIRISNCNQAIIKNNKITKNSDGIELTGYLTSPIDIEQNDFKENLNGMLLQSDSYTSTTIINNRFSENTYGFYVSTTTKTIITRNYVWNNSFGVFYETGIDHESHFNDIYDNDVAMDVEATAGVDAQYNYWGHKSGPYHESMNPRGRGNMVGGNGTNPDFVFFLSAPIDYGNQPPMAVLLTDKSLTGLNQNVTFMGTDSTDDGRVDQYSFNFGDGHSSGWTTLPLFNHTYSTLGTYNATLIVKDDFNTTSQNAATATIRVEDLSPLNVALTTSTETANYNGAVSVTVYVWNEFGAVENGTVKLFSLKGGSFDVSSGLTDATGHFTATFTAPNVADVLHTRIIATASAPSYADGSDFKSLTVIPALRVEVSSYPAAIKSEGTATVNILVMIGSEEPVSNALVILWCDAGSLAVQAGTTDSNGNIHVLFTAPQTLSSISVTIAANATKMGYVEGQGQGTITVEPNVLAVEMQIEPMVVISETSASIAVHVSCDASPVSGATITIASNLGGTFSDTQLISGADGNVFFTFTAPRVTILEGETVTITADAMKTGYVSGNMQVAISVVPRMLVVQINAESVQTISESVVNMTVGVVYQYDMSPVPYANVTIVSDLGGQFLSSNELTNVEGNATFHFIAPLADAPMNVTLTVSASKIGYVDGQDNQIITVNPGTLCVEVKTDSQDVMSGGTTVVEAHVVCNETGADVVNASVTVGSTYGNLSTTAGHTGSDGRCTFIFTAPRTAAQLSDTVTVSANKTGYLAAGNQTTVNIAPEAESGTVGGLSLLTILLIFIPVIAAVVIIVLLKLKVISFSASEEET